MNQSTDMVTSMKPRPLSLVTFHYDMPEAYHRKYPFVEGDAYVFHGEIMNMPGHCVVSDMKTGQVFSGYHTENFREIAEDEL